MSLSPCRIPYYAFNNSIYTSQIFRTKIKIILYLLQSHLTQLNHLYQTPSPSLVVASLDLTHVSTPESICTLQALTLLHDIRFSIASGASTQFAIPPHCRWPLFIQTMSNRVENIWRKPVSQLIPFCGTRFWAV